MYFHCNAFTHSGDPLIVPKASLYCHLFLVMRDNFDVDVINDRLFENLNLELRKQ